MNGKLNDPAWKAVPWTQDFVDIEGAIRPKPRFRTRAKMLWDDECFYVGAKLEEPHVWATLTQRDSVIFHDPDFEIFIDPDGDNHQYYELEINALNTLWDLRLVKPYRDGGPALNEWDLEGIKTAVHVDGTINDPRDSDAGWSVEFAMPWESLKEYANSSCPPRQGDQWRIDFSRVEWDIKIVDGKYVKIPNRPEHNWVWSPQGVIDMHRPETWGYVQFSTRKPGADSFVPDPAWTVRERLIHVYYAQRDYQKVHGRFAESVAELGLRTPMSVRLSLNLTPTGFTASAPLIRRGRSVQTWHVREDSRIWSD